MTQDKAEQIRIEQDYFDHAWDAHEARATRTTRQTGRSARQLTAAP